jgi:hypothetical protein
VCPRDDELRLRERRVGPREPIPRELGERPGVARVPPRCPRADGAVAGAARLHQLLGALAVLLEIGMRWKRKDVLRIRIHANLLSTRLESAPIRLKEGSSNCVLRWVGTALFAD